MLIEGDPTYRALGTAALQRALERLPARNDAFGLVDLTFGPGLRFHFVGCGAWTAPAPEYRNACRSDEGRTGNLDVLCGYDFALVDGLWRR